MATVVQAVGMITVGPIDMSTVGSATLSFDYQSVGFDLPMIGFLVVTTLVPLHLTLMMTHPLFSCRKIQLVSGFTVPFGSVGADVTSATLVLAAKQNGGSDYAGFDNVVVTADTFTLSARTCDNVNSCQAT